MRKNTVFRIVIIAAIVITAAVVIVMFCRTLILTDAGETPAQDSSTEDQNSKLSRYDDGDGFCIKDGVLLAYIGSASEVEVPGDVTEIGEDAFSSDMQRGVKLTKVTVPGTVKTIDQRSFSFTAADVIVIKEGVTSIGDSAFMDSYISEIWFPKSLTSIGDGIMSTEEGLWDTVIHLKKGSAADKYFKADMPYGDVKLEY